jgi:hypothetical protein
MKKDFLTQMRVTNDLEQLVAQLKEEFENAVGDVATEVARIKYVNATIAYAESVIELKALIS